MPAQTVVLPSFAFAGGNVFEDVPVALHAWGTLNERADNAVVVCHALTGFPDVSEWWEPLLGPGRVLDTERFFVVCLNVPGSPYGTLSPASKDADGQRLGSRFPVPTIRDAVRMHRAALERLGVRGVALAIGGSMGGMQALEWGFETTEDGRPFVRALCPIACGAAHSAWCIGWGEAERMAIRADANWLNGDYPPHRHPDAGLAAARAMAMLSYRSPAGFSQRHGRRAMPPGHPFSGQFAVVSYLHHQAQRLVDRFDAACYVRITEMMDTHDVSAGRAPTVEAALATLAQPVLAVGIDSDVLYLPSESRQIAEACPNGTYAEIASPWGHDAFLIEFDQLDALLRAWFASNDM
ncbi:MAG: homoserine O-acetyltransferase [Rhodothermales bacterium]|nr:homoserine O-acetyltransferase [Rhodothermales bacterium]